MYYYYWGVLYPHGICCTQSSIRQFSTTSIGTIAHVAATDGPLVAEAKSEPARTAAQQPMIPPPPPSAHVGPPSNPAAVGDGTGEPITNSEKQIVDDLALKVLRSNYFRSRLMN